MKSFTIYTTLAALPAAIAANTYPTTVEIGVVFPMNKTYNTPKDFFPAVFAVQNAEHFFKWAPSITWNVTNSSSDTPLAQGGKFYAPYKDYIPLDIINNMWWPSSISGLYRPLSTGKYHFTWAMTAQTCTLSGEEVIFYAGTVLVSGAIDFELVEDGSGKAIDFAAECPIYGGKSTATGAASNLDGGCPFVAPKASDNSHSDPCKMRVSPAMASCIQGNLTMSTDTSACKKAIEGQSNVGIPGGTGGTGGQGNSGNSGNGGNGGTNGNKSDSPTLPTVSISSITLLTILSIVLFNL